MIQYESEHPNKVDYLYHQSDENLNFGAHIHTTLEYIYCKEGSILLNIATKPFTLTEGNAALILPMQVHSYVTKNHSKTYLCVFSTSYVNTFYETYKSKFANNPTFFFAEHEEINTLLQDKNANRYLLKSYFYFIISHFINNTDFSENNKKTQDTIIKIIEYIADNFTVRPSLGELASQIGYSYNYLSGFFTRIFHTSFSQLINDYRVHQAQSLLLKSSDSVTQIAINCGYDSTQSFDRNFLKLTGVTPTEFRLHGGAFVK